MEEFSQYNLPERLYNFDLTYKVEIVTAVFKNHAIFIAVAFCIIAVTTSTHTGWDCVKSKSVYIIQLKSRNVSTQNRTREMNKLLSALLSL